MQAKIAIVTTAKWSSRNRGINNLDLVPLAESIFTKKYILKKDCYRYFYGKFDIDIRSQSCICNSSVV